MPRKHSGCLLSSNRRPISTTRFPSSTAAQMRSATCGADNAPDRATYCMAARLRALVPIPLSPAAFARGSGATKGKSASEGSSVSCSSAAPPCRLRSTSKSRRRIIRRRSADVRLSRARKAERMFSQSDRRADTPDQQCNIPDQPHAHVSLLVERATKDAIQYTQWIAHQDVPQRTHPDTRIVGAIEASSRFKLFSFMTSSKAATTSRACTLTSHISSCAYHTDTQPS